jgi:hypothetical protein
VGDNQIPIRVIPILVLQEEDEVEDEDKHEDEVEVAGEVE